MRAASSIRLFTAVSLGLVVLAWSGQAASNLLDNSPFLPPNIAAGASREATPLELRSILRAGGAYEFSLYDVAKKQSTWTGLNESGHEFVVKAFDPANDTITVEQRSRTYKLSLKEAKITPLAVTPGTVAPLAGGPPGGAGPQVQPGLAGRPQPGPIPALTPEQLRNLEADINRRRELRRQATTSPVPTPAAQPR